MAPGLGSGDPAAAERRMEGADGLPAQFAIVRDHGQAGWTGGPAAGSASTRMTTACAPGASDAPPG